MSGCWQARIPPLSYRTYLDSLCAALLLLFVVSALPHAAAAQTFRGKIVVAPEIWAPPSNATAFDIRIEATDAIPAQSMLVVRDVPVTIRLSEGRPFGPGVWVLPLNALGHVNILTSSETGHADFRLALVTLDGTSLAETKVKLTVAANASRSEQTPNVPAQGGQIAGSQPQSGQTPGAKTPAAQPQSNQTLTSAPVIKPLSGQEREAAVKLMEKGDSSLNGGNVSIAREFFKRAANMGLADAALAMGATYDAQELPRNRNVVGVQPDKDLARKWYEKARDLGSKPAAERLRRLQ